MRDRLREEAATLILAVGFLTRLPVPASLWTPARMARTPRWYPAAGLVVGTASALVFLVASLALPPLVAALLATAAGILVTGALHEDGLADLCDGLGGGSTPERALAIMRDSRIGAFGTIGLVLAIGTKVAALAALPQAAVPLVLLAAHAASRAPCTHLVATGRYLRAGGTAAPVASDARVRDLVPAFATAALALLLPLLVLSPGAIAAGVLGLVLAWLVLRRHILRRLGGYTGDCLGALQQVSELGFYLGVLAWL